MLPAVSHHAVCTRTVLVPHVASKGMLWAAGSKQLSRPLSSKLLVVPHVASSMLDGQGALS